MQIRLTQIDGSLPNIALMKLAHWHKSQGDEVVLTREIERDMFEPAYDIVYGSAIFDFSQERLEHFQSQWPGAILGGTGTPYTHTVEDLIGKQPDEYEQYDYTGCDVDFAIGFTQRGCRLNCKFCKVPKKEGKARSVNTIADIRRDAPDTKKIQLLDNDFFGNPVWRDRIQEIRDGKIKVCLSQGINVRLIDVEAAEALSTIQYRDTKFQERRLYTAWDNIGDERIFFKGVEMLEKAGIPPKHLMAYMLIGYDKKETWDRIWHRFNRMVEAGIMPYPMVYDKSRKDLTTFQRWVIMGQYRIIPWNEYKKNSRSQESTDAFNRSKEALYV